MSSQSKKIFVSSSLTESSLAAEVITQLSNAFMGALGFDHAHDLGAGDMWKRWIHKSLNTCDAGLFLVTPRYLTSQWLSAEFTALWLSEKPIYILLFPGVETSDLFAPMRDDYQATAIDNKEGIKRFLANLAKLSETPRVPFEHAELISFRAVEVFKQCEAAQPREPGIVDPSSQVPDASTYPRRHLLMDSTWDLELGDDGDSLKATSTRTEHFICQSPVMHYVRVAVAQAANILPFQPEAGFDVELLGYEYPGGRVGISRKRIMPGGNYSFQLDFHPPLANGTEVQVHYRFTIPALKVAHKEKLRELLQENSDIELRNYESFVIQVLDPTDVFRYTVNFAPDCWVDPAPPEVTWRRAPYVDESAALLKGGYVSRRNEDGGWQLRIERVKPVTETRYTLKWHLPQREDLRRG